MEFYFSPLACSLATRIVCYEAGLPCHYTYVDTRTKTVADGSDFLAINPLGQVPVLRTDAGELLLENAAILQYVGDLKPASGLAPQGYARYQLQQWLNFITTELHKVIFVPLLDRHAPDAVKDYARDKISVRLGYLNNYLKGREFLLGRFTVADAYMTTVLNWSRATNVDLDRWSAVAAYQSRQLARPSATKAFGEELALYREQEARRQ